MWAKILYRLIGTIGTVAIAAAIVSVALVIKDWHAGTKTVGQSVSNQVEWVQRVVFQRHAHKPQPDVVDNEPWTDADEKAAVAMEKDTEGEYEHERRREMVMRRAGNIILRARESGVSEETHFAKAFMWLPFTWEHQAHVSLVAKAVGGWKDRDLETTRKGIPANVLDKAREIWKGMRKKKPDSNECAIILIRAIDHPLTGQSGERVARAQIPGIYTLDPSVDETRYRTKFFCTPADAERVRELQPKKS